MKNVAIVLAGSGYLDGSEIREAVLSTLAIDRTGAAYKFFSVDKNQHHTVNHATSEPSTQTRNVLEESARIARGDVKDISELNVKEFDALVIPGGFGIAKNLSTFAFEGGAASVEPSVSTLLQDFNNACKPIGAVCIAPALVALTLGHKSVKLTVGAESEVSQELEKTGAVHIECATTEYVFDEQNLVLSTPAYMTSGVSLSDIETGISKMIEKLITIA